MQTKLTSAAIKLQHRIKFSAHDQHIADLLGVTPEFAANQSLERRLVILLNLHEAHKVEVSRGTALQSGETGRGGWLYDVNRQLNLGQAINLEVEALRNELPEMTDGAQLITRAIFRQIGVELAQVAA
jgi:hypothetical protein